MSGLALLVKYIGYLSNSTFFRASGLRWSLKYASHHIKIQLSYCRLYCKNCRRMKISYGIFLWKPLCTEHLSEIYLPLAKLAASQHCVGAFG